MAEGIGFFVPTASGPASTYGEVIDDRIYLISMDASNRNYSLVISHLDAESESHMRLTDNLAYSPCWHLNALSTIGRYLSN